MFLIDMKFISKFSEMFLWRIIISDPHLHEIIVKVCTRIFTNRTNERRKTTVLVASKNFRTLSNFLILRYEIVLKMIPYFLVRFKSILVIVGRSTGPHFDKMFEVPEII